MWVLDLIHCVLLASFTLDNYSQIHRVAMNYNKVGSKRDHVVYVSEDHWLWVCQQPPNHNVNRTNLCHYSSNSNQVAVSGKEGN